MTVDTLRCIALVVWVFVGCGHRMPDPTTLASSGHVAVPHGASQPRCIEAISYWYEDALERTDDCRGGRMDVWVLDEHPLHGRVGLARMASGPMLQFCRCPPYPPEEP